MSKSVIWDRRNPEHQKAIAALLAPLIVASRTHDFATPELTKNQMQGWIPALKDVPAAVIAHAVERLVARGITWMPKPGDLRTECAAVVRAQRELASRKAAELKSECDRCGGSGWERVDQDGVEHVKRCWCVQRGLELVAQAGTSITLALPPAPPRDAEQMPLGEVR